MKIKESIARENEYKNELECYYNSLLNGRLLNLDLENLEDEELLNSILDYDVKEDTISNNFCTWVSIGDVVNSEYNGNYFQFIQIMSKGESIFNINFSQFKYPMSMNKKNKISFTSFDATKAFYVCSIDGKAISPESFFSNHKGEKLLFVFSFPAVTAYNKQKTCYLFAHEKISPSDIRKHIKFAQYHTIKDILDYPTLYIPATTIKLEFEDKPNIGPKYNHSCRSEITDQFANSLFEEKFRSKFESLLAKIAI